MGLVGHESKCILLEHAVIGIEVDFYFVDMASLKRFDVDLFLRYIDQFLERLGEVSSQGLLTDFYLEFEVISDIWDIWI